MARRKRSEVVSGDARRASYHCVTRCTRQLHLLGEGREDSSASGAAAPEGMRKELLLGRLEALVGVMAVGVSAFAIMDNHVHLLLRVDREQAEGWDDREVLRRWRQLHPLRDGYNRPREADAEEEAQELSDADLLASCREKLCSLSQFMKEFKQHAAEQINALEETSGPVWAGRFKCKRIQEEQQLVATMLYVDLNPFAAGVVDTPEAGRHTSLAKRLEQEVPPEAPDDPAVAEAAVSPRQPDDRRRTWLRPLDESVERQRRRGGRPLADGEAVRAASEGTVAAGLSLRVYLRLLDAVARRLREGKRRLDAGVPDLLERMNLDADSLSARVLALVAEHNPAAR